MLCDKIVSEGFAGGFDPAKQREFLAKIGRAEKFVLASDFAEAADALAKDMSNVVKALPFVRLPYPLTWIEVAQQERPAFLDGRDNAAWERMPSRVGYLLEASTVDLSAWLMHLMWRIEDDAYGGLGTANIVSPLAAMIDTKLTVDPAVVAVTDAQIAANLKRLSGMGRMDAPRAASDLLASLYHPRSAEIGLPKELAPYAVQLGPDVVANFLQDTAVRDWAGEMQYMYAVLGLLNAKNASETEIIDNTGYNKRRAKRGQPPLFNHRVLKIHPRQKARMVQGNVAGHQTSIRRHFVRGHWKVRKSGIYFWRPYVRGSGPGLLTKTYDVSLGG